MRVLTKFKKPKAKRKLGGALGLLLALSLVLMPAVPVLAGVPIQPHQFYGTGNIGEDLAPEGTIVSAQIGGVEYLSTTVDAEGRYGYSPDYGGTGIFKVPADDPDTPEKEGGVAGETVDFYVSNILADQYEFEIWGITELNLTVAAVAPEVDTSAATSITRSRATLNGSLANFGTALSTDVSFEWGRTTAYGNETTTQAITSTGSFSFSLSGLSSGTTYHFRAKAVGHGTSNGADMTFTTAARPPSPAAPPAPPPGTTDVSGDVDPAGVFLELVTATSEDELLTLTIPEGTVGLTEELEPLDEITVVEMEEPPDPPEDAHVIGLTYDLGPDGATFDPPISLTFSYDPDDLPEGVAEEDLVLAYYNEATGEWVELVGVVDTENNTITASVPHFTTFAVIGRAPPEEEEVPTVVPPVGEEEEEEEEEEVITVPPTPSAFLVSSLAVEPTVVRPGEPVTVSVMVANTGGTEGSYTVILKINGVKEAEKRVTIAAGGVAMLSKTVSFSVTREDPGNYTVDVDGLSGSFTVVAPPVGEEEEEEVPTEPGINWPLIGGIIGSVIVVGLVTYFLVFRRRAVWLLRKFRKARR